MFSKRGKCYRRILYTVLYKRHVESSAKLYFLCIQFWPVLPIAALGHLYMQIHQQLRGSLTVSRIDALNARHGVFLVLIESPRQSVLEIIVSRDAIWYAFVRVVSFWQFVSGFRHCFRRHFVFLNFCHNSRLRNAFRLGKLVDGRGGWRGKGHVFGVLVGLKVWVDSDLDNVLYAQWKMV